MTQRADLEPLIVVLGPTAVGKTALSLVLAERFDGEIISADSRQFYRGLDIGTAKATPEQRKRAPHHLLDIVAPDETVGLAEFQDLAYATIDQIHARQRVPFLVGGTGQYICAVVEGWRIPRVSPQPLLRAALEREAEERGAIVLHRRLASVDPSAAERIDYRNVRRVVRALEVYVVTGRPISAQQGRQPPPYRSLQLGLTRPRAALDARADRRVDRMIEQGLVDEVKGLLAQGYGWELPAMSGLGYIQLKPYFAGEVSLTEAIAQIKSDTHDFIRHQYSWFRRDSLAIDWFDADSTANDQVVQKVAGWLSDGAADCVGGRCD